MQGMNKTVKFLIALLIVLGLGGYYVYYSLNKDPEAATSALTETTNLAAGTSVQTLGARLNNIKIDTGFLTENNFTSLEYYYKEPTAEESGVNNPFFNF